jgi:hypothetical protein
VRRTMLIAGAVAALALTRAAASAGTIAYQSDTLVVTAAPGEVNGITFGGEEPGRLSISDATCGHHERGGSPATSLARRTAARSATRRSSTGMSIGSGSTLS